MSSETDHSRQRTVAELLAQHGDSGATGRRRRRREADGPDGGGPPPGPGSFDADPAPRGAGPRGALAVGTPSRGHTYGRSPDGPGHPPPQTPGPQNTGPQTPGSQTPGPQTPGPPAASLPGPAVVTAAPRSTPAAPDRSILREPVPRRPAPPEDGPRPTSSLPVRRRAEQADSAPPVRDRSSTRGRTAPDPVPDRPTEQIPRIRAERPGAPNPDLTGPIEHQRPPVAASVRTSGRADEDVDDGPPTGVGIAPVGAESWHRARTARRSAEAGPASDGGPPTQASTSFEIDDHPSGPLPDGPMSDGPMSDGQTFDGQPSDGSPDADDPDAAPARRLGRVAASSPGQAWIAVVAQWIVGAVGGAALWVGFRFLWLNWQVVAIVAAVLVTAGLVVVVRALLRNNDLRTTVFAVLVGLLLTVSPALLAFVSG